VISGLFITFLIIYFSLKYCRNQKIEETNSIEAGKEELNIDGREGKDSKENEKTSKVADDRIVDKQEYQKFEKDDNISYAQKEGSESDIKILIDKKWVSIIFEHKLWI